MSNLLGPRDANGIPLPMTVDESIASMKASLLKNIKRSAYVYRVDCGGCNGCEIEIFATLSPLFDAERFGIKVVPSPRHADILLFTGAVTRAMRSPALRAWQSAPDPKICISYGACGNSGGIFHDLYCVWGGTDKNRTGGCLHSGLPADACGNVVRFRDGAGFAGTENSRPRAG
ncbi:formate hydrogenlyase subunit 7 [Citrobacter koseri]|uniref:Formate hydrogenlyase subunit 7 n=1 Tax=Citrobacter koseri TaxID=545 RepID=A0A2X2WML4_CITKO|nr:formate hydrogenlyase subunit 7 [Citrobacter koseri]